MQTIAAITSPVSGLVYINGRLAGETGPESPLIMPVTPNGTIYLELRPFGRRYRASAHRYRFSAARFDSGTADDMSYIMLWPGGVCEIALTPPAAFPAESEYTIIDARPAALLRGEASLLRIGQSAMALPEDAALPHTHMTLNGAEIYIGRAGDGEYLAAFAASDLSAISSLSAGSITLENGNVRLQTELGDAAGHILTEVYSVTASALERLSGEYSYINGTPEKPLSAEAAMLAAAEAVLLDLTDEASAYLAPGIAVSTLTDALTGCEAVLPMKYAIPGSLAAIGMVRRTGARIAQVDPLFYHAVSSEGRWLIDSIRNK